MANPDGAQNRLFVIVAVGLVGVLMVGLLSIAGLVVYTRFLAPPASPTVVAEATPTVPQPTSTPAPAPSPTATLGQPPTPTRVVGPAGSPQPGQAPCPTSVRAIYSSLEYIAGISVIFLAYFSLL